MNKHILTIALLSILLAGCQPVEEIISEVIPEGKVTLAVQASKEIPGTKALSLDGNTLNAYWKDGEKVDVFLDGTWMGTLEARTDGSSKPGTAMHEGTLDNTSGLISATVAGDGSLTLPYLSLRNTLVSADNAQKAENTTIDTYSFYVVGGTDNALYVGEKPIPAKVMDTQGKFISATSISVAKSDLSQPGTVSEVW